ncbi:hypothetical protein AVI51_10150 [Piscirickettsia salmonis]|uniref:hypothetical protein n=1 Tax=Piscirickettsia salmonis TaxID=1238 RepID=UPI0006BC2D04|nr:hypothetical protein [Piscirickettsia salmonis]ALA23574.1 hypothetical protein KW89_103 [Piscirickettsia salmonis]APS44023.1 hypothetical protein AVI48_06370 [Piscirickettsia salmonis]APS47381.1 hypothetical protein AVI49_06975 [Piscirickettsia salmonis]APS51183.1 hypothetical protein AVI50_10255 [Piscirickettsia salmonis]APS54392.1 hypothetical protein AVI51_10150 [Piscirickettsia salmonis]
MNMNSLLSVALQMTEGEEAAVLIDLAIFIESIIAKTSYARITAIDSTKLNFIYETKPLLIDYPLSSCPIDDRDEYHHI